MRGVHAHARRHDTPLARRDEPLPDKAVTVEAPPEGGEIRSRPVPRDDLDAIRGMLLGCLIGAFLWLLIAMVAAWFF